MASVSIKDEKLGITIIYFMEDWIQKAFITKIIPDLHKNDKDCILAIDGKEGTGKSTLGLQLCKFVDNSFNLNRVVFTPEEFKQAIYDAKNGQAIMYDEAFTGFSSRASLSGINRMLISLIMQIRQKNLFIVIILPTIFLLDKYISLFRTRALIHVYENKGRRGFYNVYSEKKKRRLIMAKEARTYSYGVKTKKKGRFYGIFALGGKDEEKKYREKKLKALEQSEATPINASVIKYREQRDIMVYTLRKHMKTSYRALALLLNDVGFEVSYRQIATICAKFGDIPTKEEKIDLEGEQNKALEKKKVKNKEKVKKVIEDSEKEEEIKDSKPKSKSLEEYPL
jgi:hypothetical protein